LTGGNRSQRSLAPVFVLGSPRSGTTLLYDMLLSAGGFAVYLGESNVFNVLGLRFGDFSDRTTRQKLVRVWLNSKLFRATGLNSQEIENQLLDRCHNPGDFLRIVMDEMAREQGMQRWAENSPEAILHLSLIKKLIPQAFVIHIIRDGRDVAMSLGRVRYVRPFPWEERQSLIGAGIYWEWIVQRGREYGRMLRPDYLEVHFEDLINSPQETLNKIGKFIDHDLDYERIRQVAYGSVSKPNTSFATDARGASFNPVGRWKSGISADQLRKLEGMVGKTLLELGYGSSLVNRDEGMNLEMYATRLIYRAHFESKLWFKQNALVRTLRPALTATEIDATVLAEDHPPEVRALLSGRAR
jgi:hypothetical protein